MTHSFDCPRCDCEKEFRSKIGGFLGVTVHFFVHHGRHSFRVGFPLIDEQPPEFEGGSEDESEEWQCPSCDEWNYLYHTDDDNAFCSYCGKKVRKDADVNTRPR